jgi:nicotinate phosphoribosyltransferase
MHPAVAPAIEYSSYIGGMDGVSNVEGARRLGIPASGTMPHALVLALGGDPGKAFEYYDKYLDPSVPRIMLVDTTGAPFSETMEAVRRLGPKLDGIRLDTKDLAYTLNSIRWELDRMGLKDVAFWISGGIDEYEIPFYAPMVEGFGVGTKLANAPVFDFALKIVEVDGEPKAKFSNIPGRKHVWRFRQSDLVTLWDSSVPDGKQLLEPVINEGIRIKDQKTPQQVRGFVLSQLADLPSEVKSIKNPFKWEVKYSARP